MHHSLNLGLIIAEAIFPQDLAKVRRLFSGYAQSLKFDLAFQNFEEELAAIPGAYAQPQGCLLLALNDEGTAGCVALKPWHAGDCEIMRLFVPPEFRGAGADRLLAEAVIRAARKIGNREMLLDSLPSMGAAQTLYHGLGFVETDPYYDTPVAGTAFMRPDLTAD